MRVGAIEDVVVIAMSVLAVIAVEFSRDCGPLYMFGGPLGHEAVRVLVSIHSLQMSSQAI